jgi:hypothetical protein
MICDGANMPDRVGVICVMWLSESREIGIWKEGNHHMTEQVVELHPTRVVLVSCV